MYKNRVKQLIIKEREKKKKLNRAKIYYENNKKVLRDKAKYKYSKLSEDEKYINREYV